MKVSIITPTFNSGRTISGNILSIKAQNYPDIEHIIVDGASSDETMVLAKELYEGESAVSFRSISEKDRGISDAFNKGVKMSGGEVIGILNSDDCYMGTQVISRVMEAFQDPEVAYVHGNIYFEDDQHGSGVRKPLLCSIQEAMPLNHPTLFVRRGVYEQFGLFSLEYRYAMDFEFVCRFYTDSRSAMLKGFYLEGEPLVLMRAGGASHANELRTIDEVERALRKHGKWDRHAWLYQWQRRLRIMIKHRLSPLGLDVIVRCWRRWKWSTGQKSLP